LACGGRPVMDAARWYPTLTEALEGVSVAIGTSGKEGDFEKGYARPCMGPSEAFAELATEGLRHGQSFVWALVMGPEDDGLASHEVALCQRLIRIPTSEENPSMNIAMAAGTLIYHATCVAPPAPPRPEVSDAFVLAPGERWADIPQKERFLEYLCSTLDLTAFFKYPDREGMKARLRRWLQATPLPFGELLHAFEAVYHLRSWGLGRFEKRDFLGKYET